MLTFGKVCDIINTFPWIPRSGVLRGENLHANHRENGVSHGAIPYRVCRGDPVYLPGS